MVLNSEIGTNSVTVIPFSITVHWFWYTKRHILGMNRINMYVNDSDGGVLVPLCRILCKDFLSLSLSAK